MGQHLIPKNNIGVFKTWFQFPLECCNYLWPAVFATGQWYYVYGADERFPADQYCPLLEHGFPVTEDEARIMARMVRNWLAVQRSLKANSLWPQKQELSADFERMMQEFVDWADESGGFEVW
jgi:hypothetical protein